MKGNSRGPTEATGSEGNYHEAEKKEMIHETNKFYIKLVEKVENVKEVETVRTDLTSLTK